MSAGDINLQPDIDDVLQEETPEPAVAVHVEGPVRTQILPRKAGSTFTKTVGTTPQRILRQDHRRAGAYLTSFGADLLLAFDSASAQEPSRMARWPALTPFPSEAITDIWVASESATSEVSIITELWATGEMS
jgi:hypothetical protein